MSPAGVVRLLGIFDRCDLHEGLLWHVKDSEVTFAAMCSDFFYWGTADAESIEEDDLDLLESCANDLSAVDAEYYLNELFAARKRGMRPQTPWGRSYGSTVGRYTADNLPPNVRALFDAAGPVRDPKSEG